MPATDQGPAAVRRVGAIASLSHDGPEDADFAIVDVCLFARVSDGEQIADPRPPSVSVRIERSKLAAAELSVQMALRLRQPPTGARREAWERIAAELAARGIDTDPEALHATRFEFLPDDELRAAQQAVWPVGH